MNPRLWWLCALILSQTVFAQEGSGEGSGIDEDDVCPPILDIAFLLDTSGSIEQIYAEHVKWTVDIADALPIDQNAVRVTTIQYAGYPLTEFSLNELSSSADVVKKLKTISFQSGVTRTGYALRKADSELSRSDRGARENAHKVIVLFTDGLSIDDPLKASDTLRNVKGVKIYVVSVGSDGFVSEMQRIAGNKENTFGPSELSRLRLALQKEVEDSRKCSAKGSETSNTLNEEQLLSVNKAVLARSAVHDKVETPATVSVTSTSVKTAISQPLPAQSTQAASVTPVSRNQVVTANTVRIKTTTEKVQSSEKEKENEKKAEENRTVKVKKVRKVWRKKTTTPQPSTAAVAPSTKRTRKIVKVIKKNSTTSSSSTTTTRSTRAHRRSTTASSVASDEVTRPRPTDRSSSSKRTTATFSRSARTTTAKSDSTLNSSSPNTKTTKVRTSRSTTTRSTTPSTTTLFTSTTPRKPRNLNRLFAARNFVPGAPTECALDVLFVVDSSGSVVNAYNRQKAMLLNLLGSIDVTAQSHRVALLQFAGAKLQKTEWTFDKFTESTQLMKAFDNVRHFTGTTYIGAALESAKNVLATRRRDAETIVVLLSDGFSQDDPLKPAHDIVSLPNVDFFAVSLSDLSNMDLLNRLTEDPEKVFAGSEVDLLKDKLIQRFKCKL